MALFHCVQRTFPVERFYLSDAIEHCGYDCRGSSFCRPEVTAAVLSKRSGDTAVVGALPVPTPLNTEYECISQSFDEEAHCSAQYFSLLC